MDRIIGYNPFPGEVPVTLNDRIAYYMQNLELTDKTIRSDMSGVQKDIALGSKIKQKACNNN